MKRLLAGVLGLIIVVLALGWWLARPTDPGPFYRYDGPLTAAPGTLLRQEAMALGLPQGARAMRILYVTTRPDGSAAVASALVVIPPAGAATPPPLIAYAHGTSGIRTGCAPSAWDDPFPLVPAWPALLAEGWAYVGTDYVGLGTAGDHFYLVGEDSARAVLDSIRAARQIDGLAPAPGTAAPAALVWGHSQGGHSALWSGQRAADYAPELTIVGIAAISPASDLPRMVEQARAGPFGRLISAYVAQAYAAAYPDLDMTAYLAPGYGILARDIASRCLEVPDILVSLYQTRLLPQAGLFARDPAQGPLGALLVQNVPRGPFAMPVLIAQGALDELVLTPVQDGYVAALCAAGVSVDYRVYPGRDHLSIVAPEAPLTAELIAWSHARLRNEPVSAACPP